MTCADAMIIGMARSSDNTERKDDCLSKVFTFNLHRAPKTATASNTHDPEPDSEWTAHSHAASRYYNEIGNARGWARSRFSESKVIVGTMRGCNLNRSVIQRPPRCRSMAAVSAWPFSSARATGVCPLSVSAFTSAPWSINNLASSVFPFWAASWSGV